MYKYFWRMFCSLNISFETYYHIIVSACIYSFYHEELHQNIVTDESLL